LGNAWIGFLSQKISVKSTMAVESALTCLLILATLLVFRIMKRKNPRISTLANLI
jgi:hypothetical protein